MLPAWSPAMPPALAAAAAGGRIKKRAGLPKLLHRFFVKVLRLRPSDQDPTTAAALGACYYGAAYRMGSDDDDEYCYLYSYGGGGAGASWAAGVLSSIPEEELEQVDDDDDDDSSDSEEEDAPADVVAPAVLRKKAKSDQSERFVVGTPEAATVVHVEVLL